MYTWIASHSIKSWKLYLLFFQFSANYYPPVLLLRSLSFYYKTSTQYHVAELAMGLAWMYGTPLGFHICHNLNQEPLPLFL